jgi:hypothetical protein
MYGAGDGERGVKMCGAGDGQPGVKMCGGGDGINTSILTRNVHSTKRGEPPGEKDRTDCALALTPLLSLSHTLTIISTHPYPGTSTHYASSMIQTSCLTSLRS